MQLTHRPSHHLSLRPEPAFSVGPLSGHALREVVSVTMALLVLVATFRLVRFPPIAFVLAVGVYFGVRRLLSDLVATSDETPDVTVLETAAGRFDVLADEVAGRECRPEATIHRLAIRLRELAGHVERVPSRSESIREFLDLQLPRALRLIEQYAVLAGQPHLDEAARRELVAAERTLERMQGAFEHQIRRVLDRDVREIGVERRVFDELLELDEQIR